MAEQEEHGMRAKSRRPRGNVTCVDTATDFRARSYSFARVHNMNARASRLPIPAWQLPALPAWLPIPAVAYAYPSFPGSLFFSSPEARLGAREEGKKRDPGKEVVPEQKGELLVVYGEFNMFNARRPRGKHEAIFQGGSKSVHCSAFDSQQNAEQRAVSCTFRLIFSPVRKRNLMDYDMMMMMRRCSVP